MRDRVRAASEKRTIDAVDQLLSQANKEAARHRVKTLRDMFPDSKVARQLDTEIYEAPSGK